MDYENGCRHKAHTEMEFRLYQDGMFRRKVLWRSSSVYRFLGFFLIVGIDNDVARFIESALHSPCSTSFLAPPCLVFEILGINGLLSRMGGDFLSLNSSHFC